MLSKNDRGKAVEKKEKNKTHSILAILFFYSIYSTRFIYGFNGDFLNSTHIYKNVSISRSFSIQIVLNLKCKTSNNRACKINVPFRFIDYGLKCDLNGFWVGSCMHFHHFHLEWHNYFNDVIDNKDA